MKIIILEGPDGAGKSTIAADLGALGYRVVHHACPPSERTESGVFRHWLHRVYAHRKRKVVFDRLHLSDIIYGPMVRGSTPMTERGLDMLERYYEALDAQVVICLPPWRVALQNWLRSRDRQLVKHVADFNKVYRGYVDMLFRRRRNYVRYDYTRHYHLSFAKALVELHGTSLPDGVVGSQHPRFLVIGERSITRLNLPLLDTRGSSGWLYDAMHEAGYEEHEMTFVNALAPNKTPQLIERVWFHFNKTPTILALGAIAQRLCRDRCLPAESFEHPQFWKRFHVRQRKDYVRRLAQVRRNSP